MRPVTAPISHPRRVAERGDIPRPANSEQVLTDHFLHCMRSHCVSPFYFKIWTTDALAASLGVHCLPRFALNRKNIQRSRIPSNRLETTQLRTMEPVLAQQRKKILRVLFISLLLDLVSETHGEVRTTAN